MRRLTLPFAIALVATFAVVGTARAASHTIEDLFAIVDETELVVQSTQADLVKLDQRSVGLQEYVLELNQALVAGADPEVIRSQLDEVRAKFSLFTVMFIDDRNELQTCNRMLNRVEVEAIQFAKKGHPLAPELLRAVDSCRDSLATARQACVNCEQRLIELREAIEALYARLTLP